MQNMTAFDKNVRIARSGKIFFETAMIKGGDDPQRLHRLWRYNCCSSMLPFRSMKRRDGVWAYKTRLWLLSSFFSSKASLKN